MARHLMLDGVATTGASRSIFLPVAVAVHNVAINYTDADGSITAMTVALQYSADGRGVSDADARWQNLNVYSLNAGDLSARSATIHVTGAPVHRVRVNITTLTGAGAGDAIFARYIPVYSSSL